MMLSSSDSKKEELTVFLAALDGIADGLGVKVEVNVGQLQEAIELAKRDLKHFEIERDGVQSPSHVKTAASLVYWLNRLPPAQLVEENDKAEVPYFEQFVALEIGFGTLDVVESARGNKSLSESITHTMYKTLAKSLRYQSLSVHAIYLVLLAILQGDPDLEDS